MLTDPIATYRIQLTPSFDFASAKAVVPDLARLGVSHLYLSPVAEAVTGSTHGYDVVDPSRVRHELGGRDGLWRLARSAREHGIGLLVDLVPNHVAAMEPERNPWWWRLLRDGSSGDAAEFFDVDWSQADAKVIVPVLGRELAESLRAAELTVHGEELHYFKRRFPLRPDGPTGARAAAHLRGALDAQHYRLQFWREPQRNVRRFFTIDDLVAVRPEVPSVADAIAAIAEDLATDDLIDGVRIDHIDGLASPGRYLADIRRRLGRRRWVLAEKILVGDERLPPAWDADGSTGYEWIGLVDHLFTHPRGEATFSRLAGVTAHGADGYRETERSGVREVLTGALRPDLERVARAAAAPVQAAQGVPVGWRDLVEPLVELTVHLGRYRTYLPTDLRDPPGWSAVSDEDVTVLRAAAGAACKVLDHRQVELLEALVESILAGTELTRRWQQLSGPALAKGGEDRALYRWIRLAAHNEVGGDPALWSTSVAELHRHNAAVATHMPRTLLAGTTHDTKRSEDTRARLLALTELPELWEAAVRQHTHALQEEDVELEVIGDVGLTLALQTVVAAWPIDRERLGDYLVKAAREAGLRTSWTDPDTGHEGSLRSLALALTTGAAAERVATLVARIDRAAQSISLAQLALRLTAPGVPDLYQGSERWLYTLVDPDNRGELDAHQLRTTVAAAESGDGPWGSVAPKAALIAGMLAIRRRNRACFGAGAAYRPILATGTHASHVIAYLRSPPRGGPDGVMTVASRFPSSRPDGWRDTTIELPDGTWRDALAEDRIDHSGITSLSDLLGKRPAAVLLYRT